MLIVGSPREGHRDASIRCITECQSTLQIIVSKGRPTRRCFYIPFLILVEQSVVDEADHEVEKCEYCEVLPHELVYASAPSNSNRASMVLYSRV